MIISQDPEEIRAALALVAKCELKSVVLRGCRAVVGESEASGKAPFCLRQSHNATANPIVDSKLGIVAEFRIGGFDSSEPAKRLFEVECSFELLYEFVDKSFEPGPASIAAFKDGNAIFNCWPYAREFFNSITTRMALSPPPLPLLKIVPKPKSSPELAKTAATKLTTARRKAGASARASVPHPNTPAES